MFYSDIFVLILIYIKRNSLSTLNKYLENNKNPVLMINTKRKFDECTEPEVSTVNFNRKRDTVQFKNNTELTELCKKSCPNIKNDDNSNCLQFYKNIQLKNKISKFVKYYFLIDFEEFIVVKWSHFSSAKIKMKKKIEINFDMKKLETIGKFLLFDIDSFIKNMSNEKNNLDSEHFLNNASKNFLEYLYSFNSCYKKFAEPDVRYIHDPEISVNKEVKNKATRKTNKGFDFLFKFHKRILLFDLLPEALWFNKLVNSESQRMFLKKRYYTICSLLLIKSLFKNKKLIHIIHQENFVYLINKELLRYRTILFLAPMNDPILLTKSFPLFALLFISYLNYIKEGYINKLNIFIIAKNFIFKVFLKFCQLRKNEIIYTYYNFYHGFYFKIKTGENIKTKIENTLKEIPFYNFNNFKEISDAYFDIFDKNVSCDFWCKVLATESILNDADNLVGLMND